MARLRCEVVTPERIVFEDEKKLKRLTDLVHPLVSELEKQLIKTHEGDPRVAAVVLDVPLLLETGQDKWCDCVIFVQADEPLRYERMRKSRGWPPEKTKKIEKLQLALDAKARMSDYTICNNSDVPRLAAQVADVLSRVLQGPDN